MKYLFLIWMIGICHPLLSQEKEQSGPPVIAIRIPLGETVDVDGTTLMFAEVLEDSRCPASVQCVWAGRARVRIVVTSAGEQFEKELIFGATRQGETKDKLLYTGKNLAIKGVAVVPYPEEPTQNLEYELLVSKEKI